MRVEVNPPGAREPVLAGLNECFPGWGDEHRFRWYFEARPPLPSPDLLIARVDERIAGAVGTTYRRVSGGIDGNRLAGILTGAWTLPEFRARGVLAALVSAAFEQLERRQGDLLLAYHRPGGPSASTLHSHGFLDVATYLGVSNDGAGTRFEGALQIGAATSVLDRLVQAESDDRSGPARYLYGSADALHSQFIDRPDPVEVWRSPEGDAALVATRGENHEVVKILPHRGPGTSPHFLRLLAAEARRRHGRVHVYTSDAGLADAARIAGFSISRRCLGVAALRSSAQPVSWDVCGGDRS